MSNKETLIASIAKLEATIATATEKHDALVRALESYDLIASIGAGDSVVFKVGRAETRREVQGVVLGRGLVGAEGKEVDTLRVQVGEGLEAELFSVPVSQVTVPAKVEEVPAADGAADPLASLIG